MSGCEREAAQHLVERARRIAHLALAHLGAQPQQLDALARLGARPRDARVDVQQAAPVLGLLRQPFQVGQQLAPGRIGGQRLASVAKARAGSRSFSSQMSAIFSDAASCSIGSAARARAPS